MSNILTLVKQKISIDWQEWRSAKIAEWNVRRDNRMIHRAVKRARIKIQSGGGTYYVMRDVNGYINEVTSSQLKYFTARGLFTKSDCKNRLEVALAIVTSNKVTYKIYKQQQLKKEE